MERELAKTRPYTFSTIERMKGEDPHIGSWMNKATNQVSLNLTLFPSQSFLEQMHTHGIESRYLGLHSCPVIRCPLLGSTVPWPMVTQNHKPVPLSISDKEGIQPNTPGHQNKFFIYFHS